MLFHSEKKQRELNDNEQIPLINDTHHVKQANDDELLKDKVIPSQSEEVPLPEFYVNKSQPDSTQELMGLIWQAIDVWAKKT
ncbi:hypothetical protein Hs30E_13860 [Lactococcus hodotermopsidis]|uniref:Uncharacterized protein n=1 Tax=Pseudolactococcus hodotermopsidis TaxID=2709157 RepID=A0A6A0BDS7_9LACT|nr:hypothetical protein [Lactococcus hodotermopsidis]GFH42835.1 hypothetical protein Hs30E_13860 [Lactococcus hodotermopsidis]